MCVRVFSERVEGREQLEELLMIIANDHEHGLVVVEDGKIILVNSLVADEFADHLQPRGREAALGKKLMDLFPADGGIELSEGGWRGRGLTNCLYEYRLLKRADGFEVYRVTKVQRQWRARLPEEPCHAVAEPEPLTWLPDAFRKH